MMNDDRMSSCLLEDPKEFGPDLDAFAEAVAAEGMAPSILFEVSPDRFAETWTALVRKCDGAVACFCDDRLVGVLWGRRFPNRDIKVADCHAVFLPEVPREARVKFIRIGALLVATGTDLKSLVAVVPACYRHVRNLIVEAGFRDMGCVPGLVPMCRRQEAVTGSVLCLDLERTFRRNS